MNTNITFEVPLLRGRFIVFNSRPNFDFLKIKQTHSNIILSEDFCHTDQTGDGILGDSDLPKAILTADCVPIVLLGKDKHVVIHAGWRGLAQNILSNPAVIDINPSFAFIGPHIRSENYEVQVDFINNFSGYPKAFSEKDGKTYFNLEHVVSSQLKSLFPNIVIDDCGLCTFKEVKFHSYRRDLTINRNWNVFFPK
jgi:hypothetical protein